MARKWNIWHEGYRCNCEVGYAQLLASDIEADTFLDACRIYMLTTEDGKQYMRIKDGQAYYWGCRLFSTEKQARKSFG